MGRLPGNRSERVASWSHNANRSRRGQRPPTLRQSSVALPGLEPGPDGSVEGSLPPSATALAEIPGSYAEGADGSMAVDSRLRPRVCSNVARALRDLLEHAKRAGLDPAHPTLRAAEAALKDDNEEEVR